MQVPQPHHIYVAAQKSLTNFCTEDLRRRAEELGIEAGALLRVG